MEILINVIFLLVAIEQQNNPISWLMNRLEFELQVTIRDYELHEWALLNLLGKQVLYWYSEPKRRVDTSLVHGYTRAGSVGVQQYLLLR